MNASSGDPPQTQETIACTENKCEQFQFMPQESAISEPDACYAGMELNTRTEPTSCSYIMDNSIRMRARCLSNAQDGDPLIRYDDSMSESTCGMYELPTSVVEGDFDGCYDNIQLTTVSDPSCEVRCASGWSGPGGT